jgi:hypothetical protein
MARLTPDHAKLADKNAAAAEVVFRRAIKQRIKIEQEVSAALKVARDTQASARLAARMGWRFPTALDYRIVPTRYIEVQRGDDGWENQNVLSKKLGINPLRILDLAVRTEAGEAVEFPIEFGYFMDAGTHAFRVVEDAEVTNG